MIVINILYNFPPFRIKERPPFEILIQIGYVATAIFSLLLNNKEMLPWQTLLYLCLFAFQAHIAGEIMDIEPDLKAGKRTTAGRTGSRNRTGTAGRSGKRSGHGAVVATSTRRPLRSTAAEIPL